MKKKIIGIIVVILLIITTIPVLGRSHQENKDITSKELRSSADYFSNCRIKNCDFTIKWTGWVLNFRFVTPLLYFLFMTVIQIGTSNKATVTVNSGEIISGEGPSSFPFSADFSYCDFKAINLLGLVVMVPGLSRGGSADGTARQVWIDALP